MLVTDANATKTTADYIQALAAPFIAGFAVQQGVEIISSIISLKASIDGNVKVKKAILSGVSVVLSLIVVLGTKLDVLKPFIAAPRDMDTVVSIIFVSAGTEGFNSLLKWLSYKKDNAKASAAINKTQAGNDIHSLAS